MSADRQPAVSVDVSRCEAIGFCVNIAPDVFTLVDGLPPVRVADRPLSQEELELAAEAEEMCPARALSTSN